MFEATITISLELPSEEEVLDWVEENIPLSGDYDVSVEEVKDVNKSNS